jgi:hypothetical protein
LFVGHIDHFGVMRHLVRWGIGVAINGYHLNTEPLQGNHHFFAQLT